MESVHAEGRALGHMLFTARRPSAEVWRRVLASLNLVPQEALPTRADGSARPLALLFEGAVLRVATDERRGVFMIGAVRFTIC